MRPTTMTPSATDLARLEDRLRRETTCDVRIDHGYRMAFATDASLYQIEPLAVVAPRSRKDLTAAVRIAYEAGLPVLPRGAATSLSGQAVGAAVVLDLARSLHRVGVVDRDRMTVPVEAGVVLDRLNAHLAPLGLMFGPDVSTSDRATIGGMIGNNSAGARSLRYGKTIDHVRSLDVVLAEGVEARLGPVEADRLDEVCATPDRIGRLHESVRSIVRDHETAIRSSYPRILRRVSGYNLDEMVPGLPVRAPGWVEDAPWSFNLARLVVGSEGTLAVVAGADLKVVPVPKCSGLLVASFASVPDALARTQEIVATGPVAVELVDGMILDLAARNAELSRHLDFADQRARAVLAAQFYADSQADLEDRVNGLAARLRSCDDVLSVRARLADAAKDSFWKVRKAGLALLMGLVGDAKPVAFVEDTAVAPERLPEFYERFFAIVARAGAEASCYGHADVGCLHIRPILNMKSARGVEQVREIAAEVSDLVREFGGAMSGEHGDGLARSLWNRKLFGDEVYDALCDVKTAFDPENRMNPGKVVAAHDLGEDLRISPSYRAVEPTDTAFDFSGQGGFARAVELCSGVGVCRKTDSGVMCPSFMVTRDELHSTRGRANALRLVLSGQLAAGDGLDDPTLLEAMDLCLGCKACQSECPSNVNVAKLKSEVLHQVHGDRARPLLHLLTGHVHRIAPIGSALAPLANASLRNGAIKWLMEKTLGVDRRRTLPLYARETFRAWFRRHHATTEAGTRGEVVLIDDCFTTFHEPGVGQAAVALLEASGYRVRLAGLECCGRPAISKGMLTLARRLAADNVAKLSGDAERGVPILGLEPSCLVTLIDEYQEMRLGPAAKVVARSAMSVESFLADPARVPDLPLRAAPGPVRLHGHCQQRAVTGTAGTMAALRRIPGIDLAELDSGCCGMAGAFGYEHGHYEVSRDLAERVVLPAMRRDGPATRFVAPGFSCRSQIKDLSAPGDRALHPVELLASLLG
jgi:FAD/FMN-containing dehydrogenase/Fe-S oxidoreductase